MNSNVTLKQLALASNVSVATAGRAFSNPDKVKEKTRDLILNTAQEIGYKPNLVGRSLRTGKSYEIVVMIPFDRLETNILTGIAQYHFTSSISSIFNNSDYQLRIISYTSMDESVSLLKELVNTRNIGYVILSQMLPQDIRVKILLERDIPFMTFGQTELPNHYNYFDYDNFSFIYDATTTYIRQGFKKPLLITSQNNYMHYLIQIKAFKMALSDFKIDFNENMIVKTTDDKQYNKEQIHQKFQNIDAIVTISPSIAYICKKTATSFNKTLGVDIPISCATPSIELLQLLDIRCTCYFQNFIFAGQFLAEKTIEILEEKITTAVNHLQPYEVFNL